MIYVIFDLYVIAEINDPILVGVSVNISFILKFESAYADSLCPLPI